MSSQMPNLDDHHEQPLPPSRPQSLKTQLLFAVLDTQQHTAPPLQSSVSSSSTSTDSTKSPFLLPIPTSSANKSQASFAYSDALNPDSEGPYLGALPPEIATADISIAPDGSFVETSSGPAARELKRRYDQQLGVGLEIRSPYAITAFVNQHGKPMFRVGHRDMTAPAAASATDEARLSIPDASDDQHNLHGPKSRRRSRMSVHALMHPSIKNVMHTQPPNDTMPRNKLRKTRSIPDMYNGSSSSVNVSQPGPAPFTGRGHSQSVTGADMPRLPVPKLLSGDIFGRVMRWSASVTTAPSPLSARLGRFSRGYMSPPRVDRSSIHSQHDHTPVVIPQPFGPKIDFELPARKPGADYLPMPHMLREMQSFESGLTARAGDQMATRTDSPLSGPALTVEDHSAESTPHASFIPVTTESTIDLELEPTPPESPTLVPLPETSMHSRYSTDIFDVLQTYRGLPLLDRMDNDTVIKMSYRPDNTATPRDDPRFVLWGENKIVLPDIDDLSGSRTDVSSATHSSHASRMKGGRTGKHASMSPEPPTLCVPREDGSRRVLLAATIERWIAQLTSDLNYDELLDFFLTYRTYISALDLCHLLICRFHWSLGKSAGSQDEMVRRIVRVRTFVAIRYWLLTFFNVDFLPNRELRLFLASWLNTLIRDPILKSHSDGLSIVRKLSKVAKDCRDAHTNKDKMAARPKRFSMHSATKSATVRSTGSHVLGDKFAAATYQQEDSDVELDFLPDEGIDPSARGPGFPKESANAHLSAVHNGTGLSAAPKPTPVPSASAAILQQPLPLILQQSRSMASGTNGELFMPSGTSLPVHHNSLSRAFVKTIGRLGHWKRVLNSRHAGQVPVGPSADVSVFDLELTAGGDLLAVRGGMEQYLKLISPAMGSAPLSPLSIFIDQPRASQTTMVSEARSSTVVGDDAPPAGTPNPPALPINEPIDATGAQSTSHRETVSEDEHPSVPQSPVRAFKKSRARSSSGSSSDSSFGSPIRAKARNASATGPAAVPARTPLAFDVVSIDDLDLSDTSSDIHEALPAPPGLKKLTRKLPLRRDFEFVHRSRETVSSMGITSHRSVLSETSVVSAGEPELGGGGLFQQWQLNAIVDSLSDDEESGDIEATLRRLEGQINPQKQQEKVSKVDGWVKTIQERMAAGDYTNESPRFLDEEGAEDGEPDLDDVASARWSAYTDNEDATRHSISQGPSSRTSQESVVLIAALPKDNQSTGASSPVSPRRSPEQKPVPEDVVPFEILQSRVPSRPSTSHGNPDKVGSHTKLSNSMTKIVPPKTHHSWILSHKTQTLVEHFSVIDRELFMGVKFEELVLDDWMSCEEVDILDWAQFLKDRARWKAESRWTHKTSALAAVRARFNLVANFTLSEVVLTHPSERPLLVKKFIRMAWKAYLLCSYNTLVAIMAGLQSEWVKKAMRNSWSRIGSWETRAYDDLTMWIDAKDDFKFIHQAVATMIDAKPMNAASNVPSNVSTGATDGQSSKSKVIADGKPPAAPTCVPFIGIYLSQLYRLNKLPDLIDPTAPYEVVGVDPETGNFDAPAHPEVFSDLTPLPQSLQLEPLINVHKQRLIADVIKTLVAGQHLASRVQYPVDKKLFQKSLKLRGLPIDMLQRAMSIYE